MYTSVDAKDENQCQSEAEARNDRQEHELAVMSRRQKNRREERRQDLYRLALGIDNEP
jgi:hypothetical protein